MNGPITFRLSPGVYTKFCALAVQRGVGVNALAKDLAVELVEAEIVPPGAVKVRKPFAPLPAPKPKAAARPVVGESYADALKRVRGL